MNGSVKLAVLDAMPLKPTYAQIRRVAAEVGTSIRYVLDIADLCGGLTPTARRKLPPTPTIIAAIHGGKLASQLAREHSVSAAAVYRQLKRDGYALRAGVVTPIPAAASA